MYTLIIAAIIFLGFLVVLVVLAQNSKGGGLSNQFGGSGASSIMGVKKTGDLLEKLTWGFIVAIMVLTLSAHLIRPSGANGSTNEILDKASEQGAPALPGTTPKTEELNIEAPADSTK
ncbi:MAG TPA: preprotein translocase subunit SecG [Cyclobacteriaceae bacterium]|nr:preprotein translocase subunit SecG [Cyclobacteriaceae bacterium]